jgi:hypothetical protein
MLLPPAGKRQQQALMAADACSTPAGRLFLTSLSAPAQTASTRCATTRSQHNGIPRNVRYYIAPHRPTTNRSTYRAFPDNRSRRADPLTCSLTGSPRLPGQQATQGRLAHLQPRRTSAQRRTSSCPGHTHSPAATSDHCASSPTDYPGTQMPVAGRQHHTPPDLRPPPYGISTIPSSRPTHPLPGAVQHASTILREGVMWGHPTSQAGHPHKST